MKSQNIRRRTYHSATGAAIATGCGKQRPHKMCEGKVGLPEVHFYFAFMRDEVERGHTLPIVCVKERITRMLMASAVPSKSTGTFKAKRAVALLR